MERDKRGLVSLAIDREGTWKNYGNGNPVILPAHACLYREDFIAKQGPKPRFLNSELGSFLWDKKSLADVNPLVSFDSVFQTITIVDRLKKICGIELRGHWYGYITYFHGGEEQLRAVVEELRANHRTLYQNDFVS